MDRRHSPLYIRVINKHPNQQPTDCVAEYLTCKIHEGQTQPTCFFISEPEAVLRQQTETRIPKPCGQAVTDGDIQGEELYAVVSGGLLHAWVVQ